MISSPRSIRGHVYWTVAFIFLLTGRSAIRAPRMRTIAHASRMSQARMYMIRNGTAVPTGFVQSNARCHSWTLRHRSAFLLIEMTNVCVRLVRWKGLKITMATKATTPAAIVCRMPRISSTRTTFSLRNSTTAPSTIANEKMPM